MKKGLYLFFIILLILFSCKRKTDITQFVNSFIGTGGHGHTYPGASLPFGMVQLSPDTQFAGWDGCSGYHYSFFVPMIAYLYLAYYGWKGYKVKSLKN